MLRPTYFEFLTWHTLQYTFHHFVGLYDRAEWLNVPEKLILFSRLILPTNPTQVTISFSMVLHFAEMPQKLFFSVDIRIWKINLFCADYGIPRHAEVEFKAFVYIKKPHTPTNMAKPWLWIFMSLQTIKEPRRDWLRSVGLCLTYTCITNLYLHLDLL